MSAGKNSQVRGVIHVVEDSVDTLDAHRMLGHHLRELLKAGDVGGAMTAEQTEAHPRSCPVR